MSTPIEPSELLKQSAETLALCAGEIAQLQTKSAADEVIIGQLKAQLEQATNKSAAQVWAPDADEANSMLDHFVRAGLLLPNEKAAAAKMPMTKQAFDLLSAAAPHLPNPQVAVKGKLTKNPNHQFSATAPKKERWS